MGQGLPHELRWDERTLRTAQGLCSEGQSFSSRSHSCWELPDNLRPAPDESSQQGASRGRSRPTGSGRAPPSPPSPPLPPLPLPSPPLPSASAMASASDAGLWAAGSGLKEQLRGLRDSGEEAAAPTAVPALRHSLPLKVMG